MVEIDIRYEGELRCAATHGPSLRQLQTDAPVDNMGKGESFSPTDLVATGLGSCILTIIGIMAQRHGWDVDGAKVKVQKEMSAQPPRRIVQLPVVITMPKPLSDDARTRLQAAVEVCPVKNSLHPDIRIPIKWIWH